jgi:predicted O-methyltransferase YrrM
MDDSTLDREEPSKMLTWLERRRPGAIDVLSPAMQLGRLRTWLNAVLKRSQLLQARKDAWTVLAPLQQRLKLTRKIDRPIDRIGRFAYHILKSNLPRPVRYLEIGSFEGRSLAFVHTLLNGDVRITSIDPFVEYSEFAGVKWNTVNSIFTANVDSIGAKDCVRVLKGRSIDHLPKLLDAGETFDLIFIDGSHATLDVMVDAALAWQMLACGGLMIFDDYWYRRRDLGRSFRPKLAIDAFVGATTHEIEILDVASQVFVRRKSGWPRYVQSNPS